VNVVQILDILDVQSEVFMVMEYVRGLSVADLVHLQAGEGAGVPPRFVIPILVGALRGLHAAHEAMDWDGSPLSVVHRDFSPQNILVGIGGVPRVIDFGVAKALGRGDLTREDEFKGKLAYAAPEQLTGGLVTRQSDIFSAGVILWELLAGARLFLGTTDAETFGNVLRLPIASPLDMRSKHPSEAEASKDVEALTPVALRALERDPDRRYRSALDMAAALESATGAASTSELGHWVERLGAERFAREHELVRRIEIAVATGELIPPSKPEIANAEPSGGSLGAGLQIPGSPRPVQASRTFWLLVAGICAVASAAGSALVVSLLR
jgi:serine/threonine-protein kinase